MKILIAGVLTLAAFIALHIPILKKKKGIILALYALGMILFFAVYNFRTLGNIIAFYHPTDQTVYQREFLENGEYPDDEAALRRIVEGISYKNAKAYFRF